MSQTSQKILPSYPSKQSSTRRKIQKSLKETPVYNKYSIKLHNIWKNTNSIRKSTVYLLYSDLYKYLIE